MVLEFQFSYFTVNYDYAGAEETPMNQIQSKQILDSSLESNPAYIAVAQRYHLQSSRVPLSSSHQYVQTEPALYNRLFSSNVTNKRGSVSDGPGCEQYNRIVPESQPTTQCDEASATVSSSVGSEKYSTIGITAPVSDHEINMDQVYYSQPLSPVNGNSRTVAPISSNNAGVYYSEPVLPEGYENVNYHGQHMCIL